MNLQTIIALFLSIISVVITDGNRVLELNDKFVELISRQSEWRSFLVMFYAPWCFHCQQLEPQWIQVAQQLHNEDKNIFVARIDCTKYSTLSTHFGIRGFPTILFINRDKKIEFRGERTKKQIIDFALRVNGPTVRTINDCSELEPLRQRHEVFFANFGLNISQNFSQMATKYQSIDWFYYCSLECTETSLQTGIYAIKANNFIKKYDENESELEEWIKIERFAQMVRITNANFHLLLQTRKYLVIAVLEEYKSMEKLNPKHKLFYNTIESISYSYPNQKDLIFGWTSELTTINSIAIRSISPLPNLIVINSTTLQYYLIEGQLIDKNIITFLDELTQNSPKLTAYGGDRFWHRMHRMGYDSITSLVSMYFGNPLLTILLFGLPLAFLSIIIYTTCFSDILDAKDEDIDEETEDDEHEKRD